MKCALGLALVVLAAACGSDQTFMPNTPLLAISDGNHSAGNPDFFFLPPLVPRPTGNPNFQPASFNPNLVPVVDVCELSGDPVAGAVTCVRTAFGPVNAALASDHYAVHWPTDQSNNGAGLNLTKFYRIRVFGSVGGTLLGYADVDPVATGKELKNIQTNEVIGLVDGRTLPIKFSVERGALCQPGSPSCASATIVFNQGGVVTLLGTLDKVRIPPQPGDNRVITVTLQYCEDIGVDLPTYGPCLNVSAEPPLGAQPLAVRAIVSLCSLDVGDLEEQLGHEQAHLVTLHRRDGELITALPHSPEECATGLGQVDAEPRNLAAAGWRLIKRAASAMFGVRPLYARTVVLNLGGSGETDEFSDFQFALPARIDALEGVSTSGAPGEPVESPPGVRVTDRRGDPVQGATVRFQLVNAVGELSPTAVVSNADGIARVTRWVLAAGADNVVRASGRGLATGEDGPFMPDITLPLAQQFPVPVGGGVVSFSATVTGGPIGSWTPAGSLPAGRRDHTATLLPDAGGDVNTSEWFAIAAPIP